MGAAEDASARDEGRPAVTPRLSAEGITVRIAGREVVRSVSLEVAPGEVLGVFGPSGAGKSTLFRALAGEERPASGVVRIDGEDVSRRPLWQRARRGLGYLPQTPSVLLDLTVAENLAVFGRLGGRTLGAGDLEALGRAGRLDVVAGSLSGGERRRLELGRALCASPRVLLCDEPFAAIDPLGASRVTERLRAAAGEGLSVVIADHHVAEALRLCDRAALLLEGEIALIAPPGEFCDHELVRKHYVLAEPLPTAAASGPESSDRRASSSSGGGPPPST